MLYDRDYRILTDEELIKWKEAEDILEKEKKKSKGLIPSTVLRDYHSSLPPAVYHYRSLFPNNYLDTDELDNKDRILNIKRQFLALLDSDHSERDILNFIRDQKAYFIIGSIFQNDFTFGHHEAFAFREFELPTNYIADYLLVGKSSGGYEFIFIELENSKGNITTNDGNFGETIRKGLKQIEDWNTWIEANFHVLKICFTKYLGKEVLLPSEFLELDKSRIHFALVAGRREHYNDKTYRLRRRLKRQNNIAVLHYDNLLDGIDTLIGVGNY